jgi:hypothetical protein
LCASPSSLPLKKWPIGNASIGRWVGWEWESTWWWRAVADAERLSGSRWHVFGDVAREGRVLYVAG